MKNERIDSVELSRLFHRALDFDRRGDLYMAIKLYKKLIRLAPEWADPYQCLGHIYKNRNEWKPSFHYNVCAIQRDPTDLKAWNDLAIAATALKKWKEARAAWNRLGFDFRETDQALNLDLGTVAICLQPAQRPEIVWGRRIDPARAVIHSVPEPGTGYGYGDLVLIDNAPSAHYVHQGKKIPIYDELERLKGGGFQTYSVVLHTGKLEDIDLLAGLCRQESIGFDNWSLASRNFLAPAYRERAEYYAAVSATEEGSASLVGLAVDDEAALQQVLHNWRLITLQSFSDLQRLP